VSEACPLGQVGTITQQQTTTCDASGAHVGGWTTIRTTCGPAVSNHPLPSCQPRVITGTSPCADSSSWGVIEWKQNVTCVGGTTVIGPQQQIGNTCELACVPGQSCCTPGRRAGQDQSVSCAAGQYGQIINHTTEYSTCASATATPVFGADQVTSTDGSCQLCHAPEVATDTQWVTVNLGCPAGDVGAHTIQQQQQRTQTSTWSCPAGTITEPAPTVGAWTAWANTGATQGESNTCASPPPPPPPQLPHYNCPAHCPTGPGWVQPAWLTVYANGTGLANLPASEQDPWNPPCIPPTTTPRCL
jgi:hypothetical protein